MKLGFPILAFFTVRRLAQAAEYLMDIKCGDGANAANVQYGTLLGQCFTAAGGGSYQYRKNTATQKQPSGVVKMLYDKVVFSSSSCTGVSSASTYSYYQSCEDIQIDASTESYYGKYATSFPNSPGTLIKYSPTSQCNSVSEFTYVPGSPAGLCVAYTSSSSTFTCSGKTISVTSFDTPDCSGAGNLVVYNDIDKCQLVGDFYFTGECLTGTTSSSSSSDLLGGCFAGDERVQLADGAAVPISTVKVGDRVLAATMDGQLKVSEVVAVPHLKNDIAATFVTITTASADLKLTIDHLIMAGVCGEQPALVRAGHVPVGSCLVTTKGADQVLSTTVSQGKGVYSIVTGEELIVVNGILSSPFSLNHFAPHAFYHLHRFLYWLTPAPVRNYILSMLTENFENVLSVVSA